MVLKWGTHSQQVTGGIQVGIWWYTGGENVGPIFGNGQPQWAAITIPRSPQLPPMSKNQHMAPAGLAHSGPKWQPT